ncbi:MAG: ABC-F family ATP-binding cassette domain-containing protein [Candidatus Onthovivens sp.]|nr:ABC-F family ATP-binding cassette domain-containing protein [Candidatus Onthovivens sp.]
MSVISFSNVSKYFGSELILDHLTFSINAKEKVALIGNNGTGKTTIFKLILGIEEPSLLSKEDKPGDISILSSLKIGYLDQNAITSINHTVEEELLLPFSDVLKLKKEIDDIQTNSKNFEEYSTLLEEFEAKRGYTYNQEIDELISKFGFDLTIKKRSIKELSGGERMKIAFIKILLFKYDVLLLDEPTNHLDISTIEWLENFLSNYSGTIFFVSHDTYFISKLATKIIELENKTVSVYNTDYEHYKTLKKERYESLLKQVKQETMLIEKYKRFIEFYKPKPRFVSRAKDREKKLAKLEKNRAELPPNEKNKIKFSINGGNISSRQLLEFDDLTVGYDHKLNKPFSFTLYGQDHLAIVGDNGIGKTTLIKTIVRELEPISGKIKELRPLKYGYIKQNDFDFQSSSTALEFLKQNYPTKLDKELRDVLGKFQFPAEDVFKSIQTMSNGEKMRLLLASLSLSDYDILLLDEPTNHLDIITKDSLIDSLLNYEGCLIFISHDREFINRLANKVLYISKDQSLFVEGNYDNLKKILDYQKTIKPITIQEVEESLKKVFPKKEKLSNNKIQDLMNEMSIIEEKISKIDEKLEDDFTSYTEYDSLNEEKENLESRYLEILSLLDN